MAFPIFIQRTFGKFLGKRAANALVDRIPGQKTLTRAEKASEFFKKHSDKLAQGLDKVANIGFTDGVEVGGAEPPSGLISSGINLARRSVRAVASGIRSIGEFTAEHLQQLDIADDFLFEQVLPGIPDIGSVDIDEVSGRLENVIRDNPEFIESFKKSFGETIKSRGGGIVQSIKNIAANTRDGIKKARQQPTEAEIDPDPDREARLTREAQARARVRQIGDRARSRLRQPFFEIQREAYQSSQSIQNLRGLQASIREDDSVPAPFQKSARSSSSSSSSAEPPPSDTTWLLTSVEQPIPAESMVFHAAPSTIPQANFMHPVISSSGNTTSTSSADANLGEAGAPPVFHADPDSERVSTPSLFRRPASEKTHYPPPAMRGGYQNMDELEEEGAFGSVSNSLFEPSSDFDFDTRITANLRHSRSAGNRGIRSFFGNLFRSGRDVEMSENADFEAPSSVREQPVGYQPQIGSVNTAGLDAQGIGAVESPSLGNRIFNTFRNLFGGNNGVGTDQPDSMKGFFGIMMMQQAQQGISQMLQQASQDALNDANASRNIFNIQNQASETMYNSSINNAQRKEQEKNNRLQSRRGIYNW